MTAGRNLNILTNEEVPMNLAEAAQDKFEALWEKELGPLQGAKEAVLDLVQKYNITLPEKDSKKDDSKDLYVEDMEQFRDEL